MQFPITIGLRRSSFLGWGLLGSHLAAAVAVGWPAWPVEVRLALGLALIASAVWGWRHLAPAVTALRLFSDGRLECRCSGSADFLSAQLLPGATVHPWLTALRLQILAGRYSLVIAPDSLEADDFRRLRVWLRWRADFSPGPGAAE